MKQFKHIFLILFLFTLVYCKSDNIDSLKKVYIKEKDKITKSYIAGKIIYKVLYNYDTVNKYISKFQLDFKRDNNEFGLAHMQNLLGFAALERSKYDTSIFHLNQAFQMFKFLNNDTMCAIVNIRLGFNYYSLGNYNESIKNYMTAINFAQKQNSLNKLSWAYNLLGLALFAKPNPDYNKALNYYFKALEIDKKTNNINGYVLIRIGDTYLKLNNQPKAYYYLNYALKFGDSIRNNGIVKWSLEGLVEYYKKKQDYKKAVNLEIRSLQISKKDGELPGIVSSYKNIAECYQQFNNLSLANKYIDSAIVVSTSNHIIQTFIDVYNIKSNISEKLNDTREALKYFKLSQKYKDSLFSIQNSKNINELETKYQTQQKEKEISFLNIQKEEEKNKKKILYFVLLFVFFVLILIAYFLIKVNKSKKIIEVQKHEVEKQKILVDEKQKEILDSIKYAKRIQQAHLPTEKFIERKLKSIKK